MCATVQPDVVLMDLVMPGVDGATPPGSFGSAARQVQVIALTSFEEEELVQDALAGRRHRLPAEERGRRRAGGCHPPGARRPADPGAGSRSRR